MKHPEFRVGSFMVGFIQILCALEPPTQELYFGYMLVVGLILCLTSFIPWRSGRHIALFLSSTLWFSSEALVKDSKGPMWLIAPFLGVMSIVLLARDVMRKLRRRCAA